MYFYTGITKKLYGDFLVYALCQHAKRCTIICINMQIVIINILPKISIYLPSDLGYVIFLVCHQSSCLHRALMSVCVDFSQNLHIYRIMLYIVIEHYFWKIRTPNVLLPRSKKQKIRCLQMALHFCCKTMNKNTHGERNTLQWGFSVLLILLNFAPYADIYEIYMFVKNLDCWNDKLNLLIII